MSHRNIHPRLPPFALLLEVVPGEGCFVHVPALPGLCFRADDVRGLEHLALEQIAEYSRWLIAEHLLDLNPEAEALAQRVGTDSFTDIQVVEAERRVGSPLWMSGNPAVLFGYDLRPLDDAAVTAHLRFIRHVVERIRTIVAPLSPDELERKPSVQRRSVNETLTHIGNCVWWYCSRIDDALPEPDEISGEAPMSRIERLFEAAGEYLLAVPLPARSTVHVPTRFLTKDSQEAWTHTKVCRREAEHLWEHLHKLPSAVRTARAPARESS